ncbi:hypothetical protein LXL04_036432 [Taraxacum kok-saghyz]
MVAGTVVENHRGRRNRSRRDSISGSSGRSTRETEKTSNRWCCLPRYQPAIGAAVVAPVVVTRAAEDSTMVDRDHPEERRRSRRWWIAGSSGGRAIEDPQRDDEIGRRIEDGKKNWENDLGKKRGRRRGFNQFNGSGQGGSAQDGSNFHTRVRSNYNMNSVWSWIYAQPWSSKRKLIVSHFILDPLDVSKCDSVWRWCEYERYLTNNEEACLSSPPSFDILAYAAPDKKK